MNTEILIYRVVGLAFLICLPAALVFRHPSSKEPSEKASSLGCSCVHRTWLPLRRMGSIVAHSEYGHCVDDLGWTACFRYRVVFLDAIFLSSMSVVAVLNSWQFHCLPRADSTDQVSILRTRNSSAICSNCLLRVSTGNVLVSSVEYATSEFASVW